MGFEPTTYGLGGRRSILAELRGRVVAGSAPFNLYFIVWTEALLIAHVVVSASFTILNNALLALSMKCLLIHGFINTNNGLMLTFHWLIMVLLLM